MMNLQVLQGAELSVPQGRSCTIYLVPVHESEKCAGRVNRKEGHCILLAGPLMLPCLLHVSVIMSSARTGMRL
jgi:hypothetical protein